MRARATLLAAVAALLVAVSGAIPATAAADPPTRVTIVAVFDPITYGENAYVNGQLIGTNQAGQTVTLEQSAPPYTDWTPVGEVAADAGSYYSFKLHPTQTMQYRASSQGIAGDHPVQVDVAPRIKLTATSGGRTSVRFSGTFAPALPGQTVTVQRRGSGGGWVTVATAGLRNGSTFQGRLRARRPVTLRAVYAGDPAHLRGVSNSVTARPGPIVRR